MPSVEMVHNGPLILFLFPAPQAEGEACLLLQNLRGVCAPEAHYFGRLRDTTVLKKMEVFGGPPNHMVGRAKFCPPHPLVMNRVDLSA